MFDKADTCLSTISFYLWICDMWFLRGSNPDSKVHGANMGPTWALSAPDGPHVDPMILAIREGMSSVLYLPYYMHALSQYVGSHWLYRYINRQSTVKQLWPKIPTTFLDTQYSRYLQMSNQSFGRQSLVNIIASTVMVWIVPVINAS